MRIIYSIYYVHVNKIIHHLLPTSYWGEPERAPHKRVVNARSVYMYISMYILETCRAQCGASLSSRIVDACTWHNCSLKTLCVMRPSFILVVANLGS